MRLTRHESQGSKEISNLLIPLYSFSCCGQLALVISGISGKNGIGGESVPVAERR